MAKIKFELVGVDQVINDFKEFARSGERSINGFFNMVESSSINLLKSNTPVDTGKLKASWRVLERTVSNGVGVTRIGVTEDQEEKLQYVTFGNRFTKANPFVEQSQIIIQSMVNNFLGTALDNAHRWYRESGLTSSLKRNNISNTPGLTGTSYNKRRSSGSYGLKRPARGFKTLQRRVGRRSRRITGL